MKAKIQFISAMLIFGSLGLFVRPISVSSAALSLMRGILASVFLIAFIFFTTTIFFRRRSKKPALTSFFLCSHGL